MDFHLGGQPVHKVWKATYNLRSGMNFNNNRAGRLPMKIYDYGVETPFLCKTAMKVF